MGIIDEELYDEVLACARARASKLRGRGKRTGVEGIRAQRVKRERRGEGERARVGLEEDQKHPEQKNKMRTLCCRRRVHQRSE